MKNIFKRTASAILSLAIVISACSGIVSTFAAGGDGSFSYQLVADNNTTQNIQIILLSSFSLLYKLPLAPHIRGSGAIRKKVSTRLYSRVLIF